MNGVKKVATINDLSGIGRCSLTAALPVLSALGVQCCPFPTAVLSSQTEFDKFTFLDITDEMIRYKETWSELGINFDCIYSGFLGSEKQIDIVLEFFEERIKALKVVDPVMGDNGVLYDTFTNEMCSKIKKLVSIADIVTPNLTEACILTGEIYDKYGTSNEKVMKIAREIASMGPEKVIITGIIRDNKIYNFAYDKNEDKHFYVCSEYNNESYSGTGDIFTSIIVGLLLNGHDLNYSIKNASKFIYDAINFTSKFNTNPKEGIMFELFLKELILINEHK
ncbi:pyridoxamine kinase [Clostridium sp. AL.422]|uniref:pyridoxamine kinase n=1 Tax=Clostridium TaxID=1485 RepID=UPI00293DF8B9|nr:MULTISPECIES: pyridoxamine kinase [unclassified Clostridium]MDV4152778.1 pyridoxamine kinase [Clostridium sp. AL.422]